MMQWLNVILWNSEKTNAIFYRKTSSVLKEKAFNPYMNVAEKMGISEHLTAKFHHLAREIVYPKGNRLIFDFCDEGGKSKGISNVTYVIIDEIDQLTLDDFMAIATSFRGDDRIRFIILFNPVSERHWLKKTFFDYDESLPHDEQKGFYSLAKRFHYTIEDNKFATVNDYKMLDALKDTDYNAYRVSRLGLWGSLKIDDPFIDGFNYNLNTKPLVPFFKDYPLAVGFDFGKTETCTVGQFFRDYEVESDNILSGFEMDGKRIFNDSKHIITRIAEYRVGKAQSNLDIIVSQIVDEFGTDTEYIIYGDTSGGSDEYSKFAELRVLFEEKGCFIIHFPPRVKPSYIASRAVTNWCFRSLGSNYIISSDRCPVLIDDLQQVRVSHDGRIDKNDAIQRNIGHCLDASRYLDYHFMLKEFYTTNKYYAETVLKASTLNQLSE